MYLPSLPETTRYFDCSASVVQLGLTMGMNEGRDNAGGALAVLGLGGYVFGAGVSDVDALQNKVDELEQRLDRYLYDDRNDW